MTAQLESDLEQGIDPADLAVVLRVLAQLDDLPLDHPDAITVRVATAGIYKTRDARFVRR